VFIRSFVLRRNYTILERNAKSPLPFSFYTVLPALLLLGIFWTPEDQLLRGLFASATNDGAV